METVLAQSMLSSSLPISTSAARSVKTGSTSSVSVEQYTKCAHMDGNITTFTASSHESADVPAHIIGCETVHSSTRTALRMVAKDTCAAAQGELNASKSWKFDFNDSCVFRWSRRQIIKSCNQFTLRQCIFLREQHLDGFSLILFPSLKTRLKI